MLNQEPRGRTLPVLISLIVVGVLLMTFDVRSQGEGVVAAVRTGTQTLIAPLQKAASYVVNPVTDMIDSLSNVTNLREENAILRGELADSKAALIAVQDQLARLEFFEQLYEMESAGDDIGRTVANVIGRPDAFDAALIIDKGTSDGLLVGQPVVDTNGYAVGIVKSVTRGSATIVPITADRQALTVIVGDQVGSLLSQVVSSLMRLEILDAREPVLAGERVVTSAQSVSFPAGVPVGLIAEDAAPIIDTLISTVEPFVNPDTLRLVVVLAWPPDPISIIVDDTIVPEQTTTTTTTEGSTTTSGDGG
ncbi:MAG: rod shape-determining protein MreC [Actinomycetota bacterium]|nr:rod shape-determining protein MreC [Actinomycetota bacterium]